MARNWRQGKLMKECIPRANMFVYELGGAHHFLSMDFATSRFSLGDWVKIKNAKNSPLMMVTDIDFQMGLVTCSWFQGTKEQTFMEGLLERFTVTYE